MRVRFAPSPTGHLHVGNARTALFNWLLARGSSGTLILRVEDTDAERSSRESERSILEDLRWLGLDWDEGPDAGGVLGPYRQSERLDIYHAHAARLLANGQAYFCFCTSEQLAANRKEALATGQQPKYSGKCRGVDATASQRRAEAGEPAAIRFRVSPGADVVFADVVRGEVRFSRDVIGDPIIVRSDGNPAYNFAVVVDDALMQVTHVIRGEDRISNTPRQVLLYEAFGYAPPLFAHLSLVLGPDQTPLSKRHGATSVAEFRARGILPEALVNYLALLGWSPGGNEEILPLDQMARRFALSDVGKTAGVFDFEKLAWMNRHYLRVADPRRLATLLEPYLAEAGFLAPPAAGAGDYLARRVVPMVAGAVNRLDEAVARVRFLFVFDVGQSLSRADIREELAAQGAREVVVAMTEELRQSPRMKDREAFRAMAARVRQRTGQKGRALFHPMRLSLTGEADGPELDLAVPAIDEAAELPPSSGMARVIGSRERAAAFARALRELAG